MARRPTRSIPATYPDQFTGTVGWGTMANSLTEVDAKGNIMPDLAESFEPSDGAKTWVFKLRKGVTFHNGKTGDRRRRHRLLPPSSWARIRNRPPSRCSRPVTDIKADGAETVVFELSGGNADFPYIVSRLSHSDHAGEG